ncbi:hypothetical protein [Evansella cellulosilytica]|uniref:Uncharacterized protein n=1 Tax=Evansella cellulosilytica (strain ATCC 21833 / DSM 2522 / FERM P-1141 / JCM 9156 / N-4) TaxID=649639 RepID=E6TQP6_EVAC2|nr:hypothetical protein [Evansella cellulosilytica]ADU30557.1 hypothetical protein Bcell_2297 [Evansella cellulosilytica DSM 2522]
MKKFIKGLIIAVTLVAASTSIPTSSVAYDVDFRVRSIEVVDVQPLYDVDFRVRSVEQFDVQPLYDVDFRVR